MPITKKRDEGNFDARNSEFLKDGDIPEKAKGKWIAISEGQLIALADSEMEAYQIAASKSNNEDFLLTKIPDDSKARVL